MVTGQRGPTVDLGAASAAAHRAHYSTYDQHYRNGAAGPSTARADLGPGLGLGTSAAAAIDVDSLPAAPRRPNPKKPVCIGAFMSRAIMLYPQSCAMAGCGPPAGSRWDLVNFRGVEMIRVKLKVSALLPREGTLLKARGARSGRSRRQRTSLRRGEREGGKDLRGAGCGLVLVLVPSSSSSCALCWPALARPEECFLPPWSAFPHTDMRTVTDVRSCDELVRLAERTSPGRLSAVTRSKS